MSIKEEELLANPQAGAETVKNSPTQEPCVGIFWLFEGKLIIDSTPLSKAEPYGTALGHPTGHDDYWSHLQDTGRVPTEVEYLVPPRGRVVFQVREERFDFLADKCILSNRRVVREIKNAMHLPLGKTTEDGDTHYKCSGCLNPAVDDEDF
jgi:hypothetical protein